MTVYVNDTFTDTDNTTLSSHTPDSGGAWSAQGGLTELKISGNKLITGAANGTNANYRCYINATGFGSVNQELTCTATFTGADPNYFGPTLRGVAAGTGYCVLFTPTGSGTGTVQVVLYETYSVGAALIAAANVVNGDTILCSAELLNSSDCTLTLKVNGSHVSGSPYSHTGGAASTRNVAGYPGFYGILTDSDLAINEIKFADIGESGSGASIPIAAISGNLIRMHSGAQ